MKNLNKALVGTVAAGAMAFSAAPAVARDNDRIDAGEVIAGALIIGGIAAVISSSKKDRDGRYYDRRGYRDRDYRRTNQRYRDYNQRGYRHRLSQREAITKCVNRAERRAIRYGARRADVTDIRDVERTRHGWKVKGRIAVQSRYYRGSKRRGQGWGNDYRGYNRSRHAGYDSGKFTCKINYDRVDSMKFSGVKI